MSWHNPGRRRAEWKKVLGATPAPHDVTLRRLWRRFPSLPTLQRRFRYSEGVGWGGGRGSKLSGVTSITVIPLSVLQRGFQHSILLRRFQHYDASSNTQNVFLMLRYYFDTSVGFQALRIPAVFPVLRCYFQPSGDISNTLVPPRTFQRHFVFPGSNSSISGPLPTLKNCSNTRMPPRIFLQPFLTSKRCFQHFCTTPNHPDAFPTLMCHFQQSRRISYTPVTFLILTGSFQHFQITKGASTIQDPEPIVPTLGANCSNTISTKQEPLSPRDKKGEED